MLKTELKQIYLKRQRSFSAADITEKSFRISKLFFQKFDLSKVKILHCFLPIETFNEIDTRLILKKVWSDFPNIQTFVPRINFQTGKIENLKFSAETVTAKNNWEIFEPTHDQKIETEKIDLVLVPLLCFDRRGFRVGYGKGFYDKFLKNCRADCLKIGLNYFAPVEKIFDLNEFDISLDYCVTPDKIWEF